MGHRTKELSPLQLLVGSTMYTNFSIHPRLSMSVEVCPHLSTPVHSRDIKSCDLD